jgi:hypothetical protein
MEFIDEKLQTDGPNYFDRKSRYGWHRVGDDESIVTYGRPYAGTGNLALVHIDAKPTLVVVTSVDAAEGIYRVIPYCPSMRIDRLGEVAALKDTIEIDMRAEAKNRERVNAPLPTCCVCMNAPSNCFLWCRCAMPCLCTSCAGIINACPQCRDPIARDIALSPYGWGNIGAMYPVEWSRSKMTLFLRTLTGKRITIQARSSDTILEIKRLVHDKEGVPADQQRMKFAGKLLDDRLSLSFYGIAKESSIDLILRLCGD